MEDTIIPRYNLHCADIYIPFANSDIYLIPSKSRQLRPVNEIRRVDGLGKHALASRSNYMLAFRPLVLTEASVPQSWARRT